MLDWIFDGIVNWVASIVTQLLDAVSGLFLNALGTDMTAMEGYFPFVTKAFTIMQYAAWALLFIITVWQLFRAFSGPLAEAENPVVLLVRAAMFAFLIGYAKTIFLFVLEIARAPYAALMDLTMGAEDFTFAGIENALKSGLVTLVSFHTVVGSILIIVLLIALGWNYFKLLLEVVERYVVVGVLCYTSPLAYTMGASKGTSQVFKSWCRMIGSQLLLLVLNVWFLRAFNSSVGQFISNGGALTNGYGNIFLWLFCALAFLKTAQRFDSYLSSIGLNVAQTGSGLGMEMLVAMRTVTGLSGGFSKAGNMFGGGGSGRGGFGGGRSSGAGGAGFGSKFADRFKGNSYVRDAVVKGGARMGAGGAVGFIGRMVGGIAARNGAALTGNSIASVANRLPNESGGIAGAIADKSLGNYMPHLKGKQLEGTQITGGQISTKATGADGKQANLNMYNASQFEKPNGPSSTVTASDGSKWYQVASGAGAKSFYSTPNFSGASGDAVSAAQPNAGTAQRTADKGNQSEGTQTVGRQADAKTVGADSAPIIPGTSAGAVLAATADSESGTIKMPVDQGKQLEDTSLAGSQISTMATGTDVKNASQSMDNVSQFEKSEESSLAITATGDAKSHQTVNESGVKPVTATPSTTLPKTTAPSTATPSSATSNTATPSTAKPSTTTPNTAMPSTATSNLSGISGKAVSAAFPDADPGTMLRTVDNGILEASTPAGNSLWYNSGHFSEPDAPHSVMQSSDGVDWYAMQPHSQPPAFEAGEAAGEYNCAQFSGYMPGYERPITSVDASGAQDGHFEVRHGDGSGTRFYDASRYDAPRGEYQTYENSSGDKWYATAGEASVERRPVFEGGKPVYDGGNVKSVSVESVRYKSTPSRFAEPKARELTEVKPPNRKK